ncbi:hypothetical protein L21_2523 [Methanoculleus chikugoensis]|uniref:Uncharacterized protein n=1 Tax=Methanoculleus chikugoensis TaxID=118126 RepID=A0A1M4MP67_9EURY|nr:hypothetical protein [Methanoculleus chikugoensis]SCL76588.1 hypothetical protein L21_2523 [Methanoculleus chikugoensis]
MSEITGVTFSIPKQLMPRISKPRGFLELLPSRQSFTSPLPLFHSPHQPGIAPSKPDMVSQAPDVVRRIPEHRNLHLLPLP